MRTLAGRSGNKGKSVRLPPQQPIEVRNHSITEENSGGEDNNALNNTTLPEIKRVPRKIETESLKQSLKRMQLLNAKGDETRDGLGNGKRSQVYESNHRRNTTLNKNDQRTNFKSEAEGTRNTKSHLMDASRALSTDMAADQEKVVAINEFLKQKLDVSKLNVRMFQSKIQRFQHKYGLNLVDGSPTPAKAFKTIQTSKLNPKLNVSSNPDLLDSGAISH
jgi:hypothetical protein